MWVLRLALSSAAPEVSLFSTYIRDHRTNWKYSTPSRGVHGFLKQPGSHSESDELVQQDTIPVCIICRIFLVRNSLVALRRTRMNDSQVWRVRSWWQLVSAWMGVLESISQSISWSPFLWKTIYSLWIWARSDSEVWRLLLQCGGEARRWGFDGYVWTIYMLWCS